MLASIFGDIVKLVPPLPPLAVTGINAVIALLLVNVLLRNCDVIVVVNGV